ncbi:HK97 family phage prohead protease [Rhodococcus sp. AQ5-07]|nr:HK97 family phage prohead protease [Rhodococcus sp. AQ5-07]
MKSTATQFKDVPAEDASGETGAFTAYASVFGNVDSYGDIVMPGAFLADLDRWEEKGDPIPLLFGHNMADPDFNIGVITSAGEDETGLKVTGQIDLESPKGAYVYKLIKERRITQLSFAYDVLDQAKATRDLDSGGTEDVIELKQLTLHEVSIVPLGANQATDILSVKAGRAISSKNEDSLRNAHESIGQVLDSLTPAELSEKSPAIIRRNLAVADVLSAALSLS